MIVRVVVLGCPLIKQSTHEKRQCLDFAAQQRESGLMPLGGETMDGSCYP